MQLQHLLIPPRVRGFDDGLPERQGYDVVLDGATVASVTPVDGPAQGLLLPAFVDAHTHLDKNYTVERTGAVQGDLFAAIAKMAEARAGFTADDVRERMGRALEDAWRSGTRAIRTHLDWWQRDAPVSLAVFEQLRDEWVGRIDLQCVSLTPLDLFDDAGTGEAITHDVARVQGVLGAFVYRNADLDRKLRRVFELAQQHRLMLDFHVDEGLHADAVGLAAIAELAVHTGHGAHVTCSHCCSLSIQPDQQANATLAACARAGLSLIALPTTNLYLQGAWDRTPIERGITRLREAAAHGLRGCIATDNVADGFYPYGSYDLLETYCLGVQVAHLAPALDWVDAITTNPARAMGLAWDGRIAAGCPADLVQLAASNEFELLSPAGRRRTVIRAGRPL
jgi:cytosine deaminase